MAQEQNSLSAYIVVAVSVPWLFCIFSPCSGLMLFDLLCLFVGLFVCLFFYTCFCGVFLCLFMDFPLTSLPLHFFKGSHKCADQYKHKTRAGGIQMSYVPPCQVRDCLLQFCFVYFFSDSLFIMRTKTSREISKQFILQ